jgi:hypothetical protein
MEGKAAGQTLGEIARSVGRSIAWCSKRAKVLGLELAARSGMCVASST